MHAVPSGLIATVHAVALLTARTLCCRVASCSPGAGFRHRGEGFPGHEHGEHLCCAKPAWMCRHMITEGPCPCSAPFQFLPLHDRILVKPMEEEQVSTGCGCTCWAQHQRCPCITHVDDGWVLHLTFTLTENRGWHPAAQGPTQGQL